MIAAHYFLYFSREGDSMIGGLQGTAEVRSGIAAQPTQQRIDTKPSIETKALSRLSKYKWADCRAHSTARVLGSSGTHAGTNGKNKKARKAEYISKEERWVASDTVRGGYHHRSIAQGRPCPYLSSCEGPPPAAAVDNVARVFEHDHGSSSKPVCACERYRVPPLTSPPLPRSPTSSKEGRD